MWKCRGKWTYLPTLLHGYSNCWRHATRVRTARTTRKTDRCRVSGARPTVLRHCSAPCRDEAAAERSCPAAIRLHGAPYSESPTFAEPNDYRNDCRTIVSLLISNKTCFQDRPTVRTQCRVTHFTHRLF